MENKNQSILDELVAGFEYPDSFLKLIQNDVQPTLTPWWFMHLREGATGSWLLHVQERYPSRQLVPFAAVKGTDDIACFDASVRSADPMVYYVHTYTTLGWEDDGHVLNFDTWLKAAIADAAQFAAERDED